MNKLSNFINFLLSELFLTSFAILSFLMKEATNFSSARPLE